MSLKCSLQMPHIATTYAAVNSLITLGGEKSLASINRWSVYAPKSSFFYIMLHYLFGRVSLHLCGIDWFSTLNISFSEINCMGFCGGWSNQMVDSGLISYTSLWLQLTLRNYTNITYPFYLYLININIH